MSKVEFKTYEKDKFIKNELYFRLNVTPNSKTNATEFRKKLIRRLIYYNEALIISPSSKSSEIFIADSWDMEEFAIRDNIFRQVEVNGFVLDKEFSESEVIYLKYADIQIRQLVDQFYSAYGKLIASATNMYKRSNARRYIMKGNLFRSQDNGAQQDINDMMTSQFKSFFEADNAGAVFQLQDHYDLKDVSDTVKKDSRDIKNLIDDIFEMTATAFHVPKNLLKGDMSGLSDQMDAFLIFEINPLAELIQDSINASVYSQKEYLAGDYLRVDTLMIKMIDLEKLLKAMDVAVRFGGFTINESRAVFGNERSDNPIADEIHITKNNERLSRGGEGNSNNENDSSSQE